MKIICKQFNGKKFEYCKPTQSPINPPYQEAMALLSITNLNKDESVTLQGSSMTVAEYKASKISKKEK